MKVLVPVDASDAALTPIHHLVSAPHKVIWTHANAGKLDARSAGAPLEVLVLNVQPGYHRHIARFTRRADRDALRAERSTAAMARAVEALSTAGIPFTALSEIGSPAERIAAIAEREGVDEIMIGSGRHPAWLHVVNPSIAQGIMARTDIPVSVFTRGKAGMLERYAVPAGLAGAAMVLLAGE